MVERSLTGPVFVILLLINLKIKATHDQVTILLLRSATDIGNIASFVGSIAFSKRWWRGG